MSGKRIANVVAWTVLSKLSINSPSIIDGTFESLIAYAPIHVLERVPCSAAVARYETLVAGCMSAVSTAYNEVTFLLTRLISSQTPEPPFVYPTVRLRAGISRRRILRHPKSNSDVGLVAQPEPLRPYRGRFLVPAPSNRVRSH